MRIIIAYLWPSEPINACCAQFSSIDHRIIDFLSYSRLFSVSTFLHSLRYFVVVRGIFFFYSNVINTFDNSDILAKLNFVRRNFQTSEFRTRAVPISGVAIPNSVYCNYRVNDFREWQFRCNDRGSILKVAIPINSVCGDFTANFLVELLVFAIATRFDSTRDNSSAPRFYVQRF